MRTRIPHLPHLIRSAAPSAELVPDRALLAEFVAARSGMAFELLVRRHGPAVWAVCRRHLANTHDAEDAFQATFLVLAKSARRIAGHASVGGWLYGVAYRVALKARRTAARRKRVEAVVSPTDEPAVLPVSPFADTAAVVHAELERLPDRYRLPLLLCDLEGLSRKEASAQLGWTEGTLSGRLSRARKLLAGRLAGRGIAAGVLAVTASPSLATTTAAVGIGLSVFDTTSSAAAPTVAALAHGAMRDMTRSFVLKAAGGLLAAGLLLGGGLFGQRFDTVPQATAAPVPKVEMAKAEDVTDALAELLGQPAVQRELKLSADARVKLTDEFERLLEELDRAGRPMNPRFWGGQAPPSPDHFATWDKYEKGVRELVAGTLTRGELKRLQQCEVQALGVYAFKLKRVADELKLTDEQTKAVDAAIYGSTSGPVVPQLGGPGGPQAPGIPGSGTVPAVPTADTFDDLVKGLTAAQAKAWKELTGEKAAFNRQRVADRCPALFSQIAMPGVDTHGTTPAQPVAPPPLVPAAPVAPNLPPPANPGK